MSAESTNWSFSVPELPPDPELQSLIWALERNPKAWFSLSLTVGGTLVSGLAVSSAAYWQMLAEEDSYNSTGLQELFRDNANAALVSALASQRSGREPVMYVHLVNSAHWVDATACIPTDQTAFWRGRLTDVQGWTLGRIADSPTPPLPMKHADALAGLQEQMDAKPST